MADHSVFGAAGHRPIKSLIAAFLAYENVGRTELKVTRPELTRDDVASQREDTASVSVPGRYSER